MKYKYLRYGHVGVPKYIWTKLNEMTDLNQEQRRVMGIILEDYYDWAKEKRNWTGLSQTQIAEILGMQPNNVSRAIKALMKKHMLIPLPSMKELDKRGIKLVHEPWKRGKSYDFPRYMVVNPKYWGSEDVWVCIEDGDLKIRIPRDDWESFDPDEQKRLVEDIKDNAGQNKGELIVTRRNRFPDLKRGHSPGLPDIFPCEPSQIAASKFIPLNWIQYNQNKDTHTARKTEATEKGLLISQDNHSLSRQITTIDNTKDIEGGFPQKREGGEAASQKAENPTRSDQPTFIMLECPNCHKDPAWEDYEPVGVRDDQPVYKCPECLYKVHIIPNPTTLQPEIFEADQEPHGLKKTRSPSPARSLESSPTRSRSEVSHSMLKCPYCDKELHSGDYESTIYSDIYTCPTCEGVVEINWDGKGEPNISISNVDPDELPF
jgi:hypothetical protein